MTSKSRITILLSCVIALLYSLPWLAFGDQPRVAIMRWNDVAFGPRVFYLFCTVLITSALFFHINFFVTQALQGRSRALKIGLQIVLQIVAVLFVTGITLVISTVLFDIKAPRAYFVFYVIRNLFLAVVVWLLTYIVELVEKLEKERMEVLLLANKNAESELSALRSQIDPHFFFNTLSTLGSLITPANGQAMRFLENMSDTFRYIMEKRSSNLVPIQEELEFLKSYLFMMNCRFGDSIRLTVSVGHSTHRLPQFALQIAVENAIRHNLISPDKPMDIDIFKDDDRLKIRNTVRKSVSATGYGIGLTNLSKRYLLLSGRDIEIRLTESYFELSLPLL